MDASTIKQEPIVQVTGHAGDTEMAGWVVVPKAEGITEAKVEDTPEARVKYVKEKRAEFIPLLLASKRSGGFPSPTPEQTQALQKLQSFLQWLDQELVMSPEVKQQTAIDTFLKAWGKPENKAPGPLASNANSLLEKWEGENWGKVVRERSPSLEGRASADGSDSSSGARKKSRSGSTTYRPTFVPPQDDKLWGRDGIMHGLALGSNGGRPRLDPRYKKDQRDAKVFGDNGLTNGDWWPYRLNALFSGAHGAPQAGISGDAQTGAYAIVVANQYEDFDVDHGDTIRYCGPGSNDNDDPNLPYDSSGTKALYTSYKYERDVRVLRSANRKNAFAPQEGVRYDGLYRTVSAGTTTNKLGGRVERFKLVRKEGQPPIDQSRPTPAEIRAFRNIQRSCATVPRGWTKYQWEERQSD